MKFDYKEMEIIENFFKWIDEILNNEKRFKICDSYIEDKESGDITHLDIGYGLETLCYMQNLYYKEYYKKNLTNKKNYATM